MTHRKQKIAVFEPAHNQHTSLKFRLTHHDTHDTLDCKLRKRQNYWIPTGTPKRHTRVTKQNFIRFFSDLFTNLIKDKITEGNLSFYTRVACSLKSGLFTSKTTTL